MAPDDLDPGTPAKFYNTDMNRCTLITNQELGLTTTTTPSSAMVSFKSLQNSDVKRWPGTPPPEKTSWITTSNLGRSSPDSNFRFRFQVNPRASCRNTLPSPGSRRPKYVLAASYTAGSISTTVVSNPWFFNAVIAIPVPSPMLNASEPDQSFPLEVLLINLTAS